MDQSNVTTRQPSKKNGKGKEKEHAAENTSDPGDNPTVIGSYLADFSAE